MKLVKKPIVLIIILVISLGVFFSPNYIEIPQDLSVWIIVSHFSIFVFLSIIGVLVIEFITNGIIKNFVESTKGLRILRILNLLAIVTLLTTTSLLTLDAASGNTPVEYHCTYYDKVGNIIFDTEFTDGCVEFETEVNENTITLTSETDKTYVFDELTTMFDISVKEYTEVIKINLVLEYDNQSRLVKYQLDSAKQILYVESETKENISLKHYVRKTVENSYYDGFESVTKYYYDSIQNNTTTKDIEIKSQYDNPYSESNLSITIGRIFDGVQMYDYHSETSIPDRDLFYTNDFEIGQNLSNKSYYYFNIPGRDDDFQPVTSLTTIVNRDEHISVKYLDSRNTESKYTDYKKYKDIYVVDKKLVLFSTYINTDEEYKLYPQNDYNVTKVEKFIRYHDEIGGYRTELNIITKTEYGYKVAECYTRTRVNMIRDSLSIHKNRFDSFEYVHLDYLLYSRILFGNHVDYIVYPHNPFYEIDLEETQ